MATAPVDKRRLLLDAATKVFAERGYHECRVGDIAAEAGVAYGLVYHYFSSKEEVLHTIFRETWGLMLETINRIEEAGGTSRDQVRRVATVVLGAWNASPDLIRLLVREVARGPRLEKEIQEIRLAFDALERIIRRGVATGELRPEPPARRELGALRRARGSAHGLDDGPSARDRRRRSRRSRHGRDRALRRPRLTSVARAG